MSEKTMAETMSGLDAAQRAVVMAGVPTRLVAAGPGSGKTRTLVAAVLVAAERDGPEGCCVVTFTNAAAGEFERRLAARGVKVGFAGTLHALCLRLLAERPWLVGLPGPPSVVDDEQKLGLVTDVLAEMGSRASPRKVAESLRPEAYCGAVTAGANWTPEELAAVEYYRRLTASGLLDFDLVLHCGLAAVRRWPDVAWPFHSLFVDEAQDSAPADWKIYDSAPFARRMFVADPDQAIYSFRGGDVGEFVRRAADASLASFRDVARLFTLETNYRSASEVCEAAQALIGRNRVRVPKATLSARGRGGSVAVRDFDDPARERHFVLNKIVAPARPLTEFAVLARTNHTAHEFAEFLAGSGLGVAERKWRQEPGDWRTAKLFLAVLANPDNDVAAYRYIAEKAGRAEADAARIAAAKAMKSISRHRGLIVGESAAILGSSLAAHGVGAESRERIHDACRLLSARGPWDVRDLILLLNSHEEERETEGEGIYVGTIHSAKGREWPTVFLVGWEEGEFPTSRAARAGQGAVEEERRLAYVGLTRAADRAVVTWCSSRPQWRGASAMPGPEQERLPSRFAAEVIL